MTLYCNNTADTILDWTVDGVSVSLQPALFSVGSVTGNSLHVQAFSSAYDGFYRCVVKRETGEVVQVQTSPPILLSSYGESIWTACYACTSTEHYIINYPPCTSAHA